MVLHLKSGKQLKTDILLWANGRTGNTDDMGLEAIGIEPDSRGQLKVNEDLPDQRAAHLRRGRRDRLSVAGQRRLRARALRRHAHIIGGHGDEIMVTRHSHRHLHQPRDQLASARPSAS